MSNNVDHDAQAHTMSLGFEQSSVADRRRLPIELIYHVIESLLPSNPFTILPPSHSTTKTLLALTRVCRDIYGLATKLLRQRCAYIDTDRRLAEYLLCIPRFVPSMPPVLSLRHITSLYLAPFKDKLDDQPTAIWVRELFCEVCESLRKLVVHMPFHSLDPLDDHLNVRRTLREGFERLHKLEEFVCVEHYPALSVEDNPTDVWRLWPDLQRLLLFGAPIDNHWLWWDIATLPKLQHVILALAENSAGVNVKDEYFHKLPRNDARLDRDIKIVFLDGFPMINNLDTSRWGEIDPEEKMSVEIQKPSQDDASTERPSEATIQYVKKASASGGLWTAENEIVRGTE